MDGSSLRYATQQQNTTFPLLGGREGWSMDGWMAGSELVLHWGYGWRHLGFLACLSVLLILLAFLCIPFFRNDSTDSIFIFSRAMR